MRDEFERVLLVRHGETEWNRSRRRQGQLDSALTEEGLRTAHLLGSTLRGADLDALFSSPLGRALVTAGIVADAVGLHVQVVADLAEVDHGQWAGLTNDEIEERYPGALARRSRDRYAWRFPKGESYERADARAESALRQIAETGSSKPLVVAHEMIARMLLRRLLDLEPARALSRALPHGAICEIIPCLGSVRTVAAVQWPARQ